MDVPAALGDVAIDVALVLVQQGDGAPACRLEERLQAPHHLVTMRWRLSRGNKEGKEADIGALEPFGQIQRSLERLQVRRERLVDADLADGRADGRYPDPTGVQRRLDGIDLAIGEVEHVLAPHAAQLEIPYPELPQDVELHLKIGSDLVRKAAEHKHGCPPRWLGCHTHQDALRGHSKARRGTHRSPRRAANTPP